tara:strand:- start:2474 stop:2734 length:261 start_codon:yes stop_codon:yes gene_type:complete
MSNVSNDLMSNPAIALALQPPVKDDGMVSTFVEAREWLADCLYDTRMDLDEYSEAVEEVATWTNHEVKLTVDRQHDGGWYGFLRSC